MENFSLKIKGIVYEELDRIPRELDKKLFYLKDNKKLDFNNENFSKIYLIRIKEGEKNDIFLDLNSINFSGKIIFLIDENSATKVKILIHQKKDGASNIDFLSVLKKNSKLKLDFLALADSYGSCDNLVRVYCLDSGNNVRVNIKSISKDKGRIFCEAMAYIDEKASKTDLNVSEKGFIFDKGRVEFFPNLQINNNDVVAGHSAHLRKFSENDIFYLMSRGLNKEESKSVLLDGFVEDFVDMKENLLELIK